MAELQRSPSSYKANLARMVKGLNANQRAILDFIAAIGTDPTTALRVLAAAGSGKCVVGDTIVASPAGMMRIESGSGSDRVAATVDAETLETTPSARATWLDMGMSPTIRIRTHSGVVLEGTPEHPLLVWNGAPTWTRLEDLAVGDHVLLWPGHAREVGTPLCEVEEAYLVGLFMGNGCRSWSERNGLKGVEFTTGFPEIADAYCTRASRFWQHAPTTAVPADGVPSYNISYGETALWLQERFPGLVCGSARDKFVPPALLAATREERVAFLQGLFDTDGGVTKDRCVEWLSASERLAREVHQMLLGLGVVGGLKPKRVKGQSQNVTDHTYWRILIGSDQARAFKQLVGFRVSAYKAAALDVLIDKDSNPNIGCYPHVGNLLRQVREEWKAQGRWDGHEVTLDGVRVGDYLRGARKPSRGRLLDLIAGCSSPEALLLRNLTQFWPDPIMGIEHDAQPKRVFDYNVPVTHSFAANGIVSHNTRVIVATLGHLLGEEIVRPDQLIVTTFTNKAGGELVDRARSVVESKKLEAMTGKGTLRRIGTFHAIAGDWLRKRDPKPPPHRWAPTRNIDGSDRAEGLPRSSALWDHILTDWNIEGTKDPNNPAYGKKGLDVAARYPGTEIPKPKQYANRVDILRSYGNTPWEKDGIELARSWEGTFPHLLEAWQLFEEAKQGLNAYDFADVLDAYWRRGTDSAKIIIVDEAQDNSFVQLDLARQIAKRGNGRLVIVGDLRQAIYRFRGADPEIMQNADKTLNAVTLEIPTNYRSVKQVVDIGNLICEGEPWSVGSDAIATREDLTESGHAFKPDGLVETRKDPTQIDEAESTATAIRALLNAGEAPKDIAVLVRTNAETGPYEMACLLQKVPCMVLGSSTSFFDRFDIKNVMSLMQVAGVFGPVPIEDRVKGLTRPDVLKRNGTRFKYMKGETFRAALTKALYKVGDIGKASDALIEVSSDMWRRQLGALIKEIKSLETASWEDAPKMAATILVPETAQALAGGAEIAVKPDDAEVIGDEVQADNGGDDAGEGALLATFVKIANQFKTPQALLDFAAQLSKWVKAVANPGSLTDEARESFEAEVAKRVVISTVHKSKGLEYKHVFVSATHGVFPHAKSVDAESLGDEKRLFYVACTRAKDHLVVTCYTEGPNPNRPAGASEFTLDFVAPYIARAKRGVPRWADVSRVLADAAVAPWAFVSTRQGAERGGAVTYAFANGENSLTIVEVGQPTGVSTWALVDSARVSAPVRGPSAARALVASAGPEAIQGVTPFEQFGDALNAAQLHMQGVDIHESFGEIPDDLDDIEVEPEREELRLGSLRAFWEFNSANERVYGVIDDESDRTDNDITIVWDRNTNVWQVRHEEGVADRAPNAPPQWTILGSFVSDEAGGIQRALQIIRDSWSPRVLEAHETAPSAAAQAAAEKLAAALLGSPRIREIKSLVAGLERVATSSDLAHPAVVEVLGEARAFLTGEDLDDNGDDTIAEAPVYSWNDFIAYLRRRGGNAKPGLTWARFADWLVANESTVRGSVEGAVDGWQVTRRDAKGREAAWQHPALGLVEIEDLGKRGWRVYHNGSTAATVDTDTDAALFVASRYLSGSAPADAASAAVGTAVPHVEKPTRASEVPPPPPLPSEPTLNRPPRIEDWVEFRNPSGKKGVPDESVVGEVVGTTPTKVTPENPLRTLLVRVADKGVYDVPAGNVVQIVRRRAERAS